MKDNNRKKAKRTAKPKIIRQKMSKNKQKPHDDLLQDNETYLSTMFNSVQSGLALIDTETHKIVDVNAVAIKLIGSRREDIVGSICHNFICPAEEGKCPITDLGMKIDHSDQVLIKMNGDRIPIIKSVVPMTVRGKKCLLETFTDITELKGAYDHIQQLTAELQQRVAEQTQELRKVNKTLRQEIDERRKSEEKYRQLFTHAPAAIYEIDYRKRRFIDFNDIVPNFTGYTREELMAMDPLDLFTEESQRTYLAKMKMLIEGKEVPLSAEYEIRKKDGGIIWAVLNANYKMEGGVPVSAQIVANDITERKRAEEALQISEQKYRTLIESTLDFVFAVDRNGMFTYINPRFEMVTGYTLSEVLDRPFTDVLAPEAKKIAITKFKKGMKGEEGAPYQIDIIHKNGKRIPVEFNVTTLRDANGQPTGRYGIGRDLTERKRAESAIKESEDRLYSIVQGSPIPTFVIGKDHRVLYWNMALEEMSQIRAGEVIGTSGQWRAFYSEERPCMADLLVDEQFDKIPEWYAGKCKKSRLLEEAYEAVDFFPDLGNGGKWLCFTAAVIREAQGNLIGAVETLEDVTEKKHSDEALKVSEERYRNIFKNSIEGIYQSTPGGVFIDVNPAMAKMCGYESPAEMVAYITDISTQYYADYKDRERFTKLLDEHGRIDNIEYRVRRKDGGTIWVSVSARVVSNDQGDLLY